MPSGLHDVKGNLLLFVANKAKSFTCLIFEYRIVSNVLGWSKQ